ncbi:MAG TPA: hypothetical protein VN726_05620, partial [Hanamia sp.]|nr:hypothetical protein [Hanamia sp.]
LKIQAPFFQPWLFNPVDGKCRESRDKRKSRKANSLAPLPGTPNECFQFLQQHCKLRKSNS